MSKIKKEDSTQKTKNKSVSEDLLSSYRKALYKIQQFFDSVEDLKFDEDNMAETMKVVSAVLAAGEKLGKNIETLSILEKKVQQEEATNSKIRGNAKLSLLEDGSIE